MKGLKHYNHAVGQNCFHIVWKVKYAYSFLNRLHLKKCVEGIIKLIAFQKGWEVYELKVMPDHLHLFIGFPPSTAPRYVVAVLKAKTAGALFRNFPWLKTYFRKGHFWSPGKFYRSVGNVTYDDLEKSSIFLSSQKPLVFVIIQNYIKYSQGSWKTNFSDLPSYYQQQKLSSFVA